MNAWDPCTPNPAKGWNQLEFNAHLSYNQETFICTCCPPKFIGILVCCSSRKHPCLRELHPANEHHTMALLLSLLWPTKIRSQSVPLRKGNCPGFGKKLRLFQKFLMTNQEKWDASPAMSWEWGIPKCKTMQTACCLLFLRLQTTRLAFASKRCYMSGRASQSE